MSEMCESCGDGITDEHVTFGYDRSGEGQGRARFLALCDPCALDYLHVLWSLPLDLPDNPRTQRARELGGEKSVLDVSARAEAASRFDGRLWGQACDLADRLMALWSDEWDEARARRLWRVWERATARASRRWSRPPHPARRVEEPTRGEASALPTATMAGRRG